ncbi:MAG: LacI family transcriptional regulator [Planctomycetes bacterium]|nr:LacI family transcriptional regulator [Planctomycetota bacterium]
MGRKRAAKSERPKRITIRDVATAAGVSIGAASTALTNHESNVVLSQETRARILKAARDLRYRPHAAARTMAGQGFHTIAVLGTEYCMSGSFYGNVLRGIVAQAEECGYHLLLKIVARKLDMQETSIFSEEHIDGVIIPAEAERRTRAALQHYEIPHVWLNTELEEPFGCVHLDEIQGMGLAVEHLYDVGHRRIAYLPHNVPDRNHTTTMRERGYLQALERYDLEPIPTHDQQLDIAEHVDIYLARRPRPTALIAYSDAMGILATNALLARGLRIPQDMSLIGNEGVVLHRFAYRPLTTICAPVLELGRAAVRLLVQHLDTGAPAPSLTVSQILDVNESTGPPPREE